MGGATNGENIMDLAVTTNMKTPETKLILSRSRDLLPRIQSNSGQLQQLLAVLFGDEPECSTDPIPDKESGTVPEIAKVLSECHDAMTALEGQVNRLNCL